ncbi:MAG TPA: ATP-grasp domain-containing protein [Ignavibacteriaceae bacterium]|nr:ATP-grasp domain-containing protein [Ignavibacteriaceae bacterium]
MALTFNVKPESETTFPEDLSPISNLPENSSGKAQTNISFSPSSDQNGVDTYAEWDTWETINAVKDAIATQHNINLVEADENAFEKLRELKPEIVFNIAEGFNGLSREAQIPAILDMLQIPYTGSDPLTLATCLDKARTKEILSYHKIPNAKFLLVDKIEQAEKINFDFPVMVKPVSEGSSKGIFTSSFARNATELKNEIKRILNEYNQPALIEEFLPGKEFTVAIMGNGSEAEVLPIVEIKYTDFPKDFIPIYSYEAKWILDTKENPLEVFSCPAEINKKLEEKIKSITLKTYNLLRCRDWSRIDVRLDKNGEPNIIEINPLPGILPNPEENSCYPKAARAAGLNYNTMINKVLLAAAKRYKLI